MFSKSHFFQPGPLTNQQYHQIPPDACKILDTEDAWLRRKVKESLHIAEVKPQMNRDGGYELPRIYGDLLSRGYASSSHVTSN